MPIDPDELLTEDSVNAAVAALASRNAHHLAEMTSEEQGQALEHYRALATDVLIAARATIEADSDAPSSVPAPGRAVIVFEDSSEDDVTIHTAFYPQLEYDDGNEVRGTQAQIMAFMLISSLDDAEIEEEDGED